MTNLPPDLVRLANYAIALAENGDLEQAAAIFRSVLESDPRDGVCRAHLAHILMVMGDWVGAIKTQMQAVRDGHDPAHGRRIVGLNKSYIDSIDTALPFFSDPQSEFTMCIALLSAGRFKEGWPLFQRRPVPRRDEPPPYWGGENLGGKTIFVWPEWVLGDHLLFASILPDLIAHAGKVIIECKPTLYPIFKRSFPDATVLSQAADRVPVPMPEGVDYQIPLNSLGLFFRRDFSSFPNRNGYLRSDETLVREVRHRYENLARGRRIVGLGWRSKNEKQVGLRCARLVDWEPLLKTPGVCFFSLLTGDWQEEIDETARKLGVTVHRDDEIVAGPDAVFTHAAAMDLVISTSNTVIHAAGTQNIPGWLITPSGAGAFWYWFNDREDSPWYPSLRLFRRTPGLIGQDWWSDPLERAAAVLTDWARRRYPVQPDERASERP